jgi:serine palmitoyltransferase
MSSRYEFQKDGTPLWHSFLARLGILLIIFWEYVSNILLYLGIKKDKIGELILKDDMFKLMSNTVQGNAFNSRIYRRVSDVLARPVTGKPGAYLNLIERCSDDCNRTFLYVHHNVCKYIYITQQSS